MVFASGLGAVTSILSMLSAGDHMICGDEVYGGTNRLFSKIIARFGIELSFADTTKVNTVQEAIQANTKVSSIVVTVGQKFLGI